MIFELIFIREYFGKIHKLERQSERSSAGMYRAVDVSNASKTSGCLDFMWWERLPYATQMLHNLQVLVGSPCMR
jgi:hypothetical protein